MIKQLVSHSRRAIFIVCLNSIILPTFHILTSQAVNALSFPEEAKIKASDGSAYASFGNPVSVSGSVIAIGASGDTVGGNIQGSVYVFEQHEFGWSPMAESAKLTASDSAQADLFGVFVSMDADTIVVGSRGGGGAGKSSVYIFEKPDNLWSDMHETAKLMPRDGVAGDFFGSSVSVNADAIVVGAPYAEIKGSYTGAAYIYKKSQDKWSTATETAKLTASDGAWGDMFGYSVSVYKDIVVIGARDDNDSGSAYVFEKPAGGWKNMTETAKLTASGGAPYDFFGGSVFIDGDTIVVGASGKDVNRGGVYVFVKPAGGWKNMTETAKLTASDGDAWDQLGTSVSMSGDLVVAGAYTAAQGLKYGAGSAYVFQKPVAGWSNISETAKLIANDADADDHFGVSVSISGSTIVIGAPNDADNGLYSGSAYIFNSVAEFKRVKFPPAILELLLSR